MILIQSYIGDVDAMSVAWALRSLGSEVSLWFASGFPAEQMLSFRSSDDVSPRVIGDVFTGLEANHYSAAWLRRRGKRAISKLVAVQDRPQVEREARAFVEAVEYSICAPLLLNDPVMQPKSDSKLAQLAAARKAGLSIPDTLISNDPAELAEFRHRHGRVIYKTICGAAWAGKGSMFATFTTAVEAGQSLNNESVRSAPGIFQEYIAKNFEVRAFLFGPNICAVRIDSGASKYGIVDWRAAQRRDDVLPISPIDLPAPLHQRLRTLLDELGLLSGSIDLIVTPEERFVFLEVNPQGQFLWIDQRCPDTNLFRRFVSYLSSGDPDLSVPLDVNCPGFEDFSFSEEAVALREARRTHSYASQISLDFSEP